MKQAVILFRESVGGSEEFEIARKYFDVYTKRTEVPPYRLVIPRYYSIPHPKELEEDIQYLGSELINSTSAHRYIASGDYITDIAGYTPQTWFDASQLPDDRSSFIVKGETNSKKINLYSLYAKNKQRAIQLGAELGQDTGLAGQRIITMIPIAHEFRCFFLNVLHKPVLIGHGFYWSTSAEDVKAKIGKMPELSSDGLDLALEAAWRLIDKCPFIAIDVALTIEGTWIVVEVNDGCQSGLSECAPDRFYRNLALSANTLAPLVFSLPISYTKALGDS